MKLKMKNFNKYREIWIKLQKNNKCIFNKQKHVQYNQEILIKITKDYLIKIFLTNKNNFNKVNKL